jgi:hypothetical protein
VRIPTSVLVETPLVFVEKSNGPEGKAWLISEPDSLRDEQVLAACALALPMTKSGERDRLSRVGFAFACLSD